MSSTDAAGTSQDVLVERHGNRAGQLVGRGPYMQAVHFDGPERLLNTLVDVKILEGFANSLAGEVVTGVSVPGGEPIERAIA